MSLSIECEGEFIIGCFGQRKLYTFMAVIIVMVNDDLLLLSLYHPFSYLSYVSCNKFVEIWAFPLTALEYGLLSVFLFNGFNLVHPGLIIRWIIYSIFENIKPFKYYFFINPISLDSGFKKAKRISCDRPTFFFPISELIIEADTLASC